MVEEIRRRHPEPRHDDDCHDPNDSIFRRGDGKGLNHEARTWGGSVSDRRLGQFQSGVSRLSRAPQIIIAREANRPSAGVSPAPAS
jgi:hypothetical protein